MENCILIGNGLNQCLKGAVPWGNLLKHVADELNVSYNPDIPMPMEFERIINEYLGGRSVEDIPKDIYTLIKSKIAALIQHASLRDDSIHMRLKDISVDSVLTTNYDTLLEAVYEPGYVYGGKKASTYLLDPTWEHEGVKFFHVHGIADNPKSICLGYEHYMGIVKQLRDTLNKNSDNKSDEKAIKQILFGERKPLGSWGEKFYTSNMAIVGLGLTESESDLWWLITHRASLYYSNYADIRRVLRNTIVFYDVIDERKTGDPANEKKRQAANIAKRNRHLLLKDSHVTVKALVLGKDCSSYEEAYGLIFDELSKNGISNFNSL